MRIAVFHNLPAGGGKRSAYEFVKRMSCEHDLDLYQADSTTEDYLDLRSFAKRTVLVPVGGTRPRSRVTRLLALRGAQREIARRINGGGYDLVFVMQCKVSNTPHLLEYLQVPSVYYCHEPKSRSLEPQLRPKGRLSTLKTILAHVGVHAESNRARRASVICANSRFSVENVYRAFGVYPVYVPPGVAADAFRPMALQREYEVLAVGNLTVSKAMDFVISSVATLDRRPLVRIVHNTEDRSARNCLAAMAQQQGVRVVFERLSEDDLVRRYNSSGVVAYPCILEPFGLVPLEAMACETPVVAVAEGGPRETIRHGETGLLTDRNVVDFGKALQSLLENPQRARNMGALGRQDVLERWTWDQSYSHLRCALAQAVGNSP